MYTFRHTFTHTTHLRRGRGLDVADKLNDGLLLLVGADLSGHASDALRDGDERGLGEVTVHNAEQAAQQRVVLFVNGLDTGTERN